MTFNQKGISTKKWLENLHPGRLTGGTWEYALEVRKIIARKRIMFRFYVHFRECRKSSFGRWFSFWIGDFWNPAINFFSIFWINATDLSIFSMGIINCSGKENVWMYPCTRWVPSSFRWNYNPYKWPYTWITPVSGCIHGTLPSFSPRQKNPFPKTLFESAGPQELCYYAKFDLNPSQCPLPRSMIFLCWEPKGLKSLGTKKWGEIISSE